jgi:hypothetical protein
MEQEEQIIFDTAEPQFMLVRIAGEEYRLYELTEAAALARDAIRMKGAGFKNGEFVMDHGAIVDIEPTVVSKCLFKVTDKGEEAVPLSRIIGVKDSDGNLLHKGWKHDIVKKLYDAVRKMSPSMQTEKAPTDEEMQKGMETMRKMSKN